MCIGYLLHALYSMKSAALFSIFSLEVGCPCEKILSCIKVFFCSALNFNFFNNYLVLTVYSLQPETKSFSTLQNLFVGTALIITCRNLNSFPHSHATLMLKRFLQLAIINVHHQKLLLLPVVRCCIQLYN